MTIILHNCLEHKLLMYPRLVWSQIKRHCGQQSKALGWFFGSSETFPSVAIYLLILVFICLFVSFSVFVLSAVILIHHSFKFNQIITKCSCQSVAHGRRELGFVTEGHLTVFFSGVWSPLASLLGIDQKRERRVLTMETSDLRCSTGDFQTFVFLIYICSYFPPILIKFQFY